MVGCRITHISRNEKSKGYGGGVITFVRSRPFEPDMLTIRFDDGVTRKILDGKCVVREK